MKIALLLLSLLAVATARKRRRILNGRVVSQSEMESTFPFVVSTLACGNDGYCDACTGSLVSRDTVLTAAHCTCTDNPIYVHFKTTYIFGGTKISAQVKWVHRKYRCENINTNKRFEIDIATLKLSRPITDITPIRLECRNERVGEYVTIIGFGRDERGNSGTLKMGNQRVVECPKQEGPVICSDGNDRRQDIIGHSDSGGPVLVRSGSGFKQLGIQIGIMTWTMKSSRGWTTNKVQVFNRVNPYCQQILK